MIFIAAELTLLSSFQILEFHKFLNNISKVIILWTIYFLFASTSSTG